MKLFSLFITSALFSLSAAAGPYVSEGPGPVGDIITCRSPDGNSTFEIRRTAAVTFVQGLYIQGNSNPVDMGCKNNGSGWACTEIGHLGDDNKLYANIYRNSQGIITAQLFRNNTMGKPVLEDSLGCRRE